MSFVEIRNVHNYSFYELGACIRHNALRTRKPSSFKIQV